MRSAVLFFLAFLCAVHQLTDRLEEALLKRDYTMIYVTYHQQHAMVSVQLQLKKILGSFLT